jgi:hypothetical protein
VSEPAYRRRAEVLWRRSLDAVVLLPPGSDDVVTVAGTGADVWDLLDTWRTVDGLVALLAQRYQGDPGAVAADLEVLLGDLAGFGAVEVAAESGGPPGG